MRRLGVLLVCVLTFGALSAVTASAVVPTIVITGGGENITAVAVGNDLSYQVQGFGEPRGQFYPSSTCLNDPACLNGESADAALVVRVDGVLYGPDFDNVHSSSAAHNYPGIYVPISHSGPTGAGTSVDPYKTTTVVGAGPLQITQVVSFVVGSYSVRFDYTLQNTSANPVVVNAFAIADIYLQGSDQGVGFYDPPSGAVGGANAAGDFFVIIAPIAPAPSHFSEQDYSDLWYYLENGMPLDDQVCLPTVPAPYDTNADPCYDDNMAAMEWDTTVPAGASFPLSHYWSFGALPSGVVDCSSPFGDIASSFAAGEICTLYNRGVTAGTTATTYAPASNVARDQMAVFMLRTWEWYYARGYNGPVVTGKFTDIATDFARTQIEQVAGLGITAGCNAAGTMYCPLNSITRAEMAIFMMRLYESILGPYTGPTGGQAFTDISGNFAETQIRQLVGLGISSGTTATTYGPNNTVTREQMAIFIIRLMERLLAT